MMGSMLAKANSSSATGGPQGTIYVVCKKANIESFTKCNGGAQSAVIEKDVYETNGILKYRIVNYKDKLKLNSSHAWTFNSDMLLASVM